MIAGRYGAILVLFLFSFPPLSFSASTDPCCPLNDELRYLLLPPPNAQFRYQVRHEVFFSSSLNKEKNFFLILPPDFNPCASKRYPLLILLHGYDFHRNGSERAVCNPQAALDVLCREAEEEYHWLLLEDIALIAAAMMDGRNKTYGDLRDDLKRRFQELALYGGLQQDDYTPGQIAASVVEHNLWPKGHLRLRHPDGGLDDPFQAIRRMIIVLPDGDNSFYTDEDEGKVLFPPTNNKSSCDAFLPEECLRISQIVRRYMKPGALGKYESYILELMEYLRNRSSLKGTLLPPPHTGIGGFSMGGFGALKIALRHPGSFSSASSQSGLVDIELLTSKVVLKTMMPEFLEVFGSLAPLDLPGGSTINEAYVRAHNPVRLINEAAEFRNRIYFDYGAKELYDVIKEGNQRLEHCLGVSSRMISVQPYNGKAGHNYLFWRSRLGNVLVHHSRLLR
jgi:enterochelin esterase-like enzyme